MPIRIGLSRPFALFTILFLLAGLSAACATATVTSAAATPMSRALQLAEGTLQLEGTDQAIDAASAAKLLPLWQLLDELSSSSSTAPDEITTVIEELRLNMSAAQVAAIDEMDLTQAASVSQGNTASATTGTPAAGAQMVAASNNIGSGNIGPGGPPPGEGGPGPRSGSSSSSSTTSASSSTEATAIQKVITLLESKIAG